jgi:hypothetical protein
MSTRHFVGRETELAALRSHLDHVRKRGAGRMLALRGRERHPLDRHDLSELIRHRALIPGASDNTLLVGVSRGGFAVEGLDIRLTPEDIIAA